MYVLSMLCVLYCCILMPSRVISVPLHSEKQSSPFLESIYCQDDSGGHWDGLFQKRIGASFLRLSLIPKNEIDMGTKSTNPAEGWNRNTDLCMDVKTYLRSDRIAEVGKDYKGVLTHDAESHYAFVETASTEPRKRNPHVFVGDVLSVTRRKDGTFRPNLREVFITDGFNVDDYADKVAGEIRNGLKGLVEEGKVLYDL